MNVYELNVSSPLRYHLTGKFVAPSENWKHLDMPLNEYELFVMTEGVLYLSYNNTRYTARKGEILLLPPLPDGRNRRKGFRKSFCSFYWLHFKDSRVPPPRVFFRFWYPDRIMKRIPIRYPMIHWPFRSRHL